MRRAIALLLLLVALAGCVAQAGPAQESLIENVAPRPTAAPGVNLSWTPPVAPLVLGTEGCAQFPWRLHAHAVPAGTNLTLELQADGDAVGRLVGSVSPPRVTVEGDGSANGTVLVCADGSSQQGYGALALVASVGGTSVAFDEVGIVLTGKLQKD